MAAGPLNVIVIDDHEIVGLGVERALTSHKVLARVMCLSSVSQVRPHWGDIAVLDLRLADGSTPAENIARLNRAGAHVVVYTSADDPYLVREAIAAGALSIVRKSSPSSELVQAIKDAAEGRVSPGIDWALALDADEDFVTDQLSELEAQILTRYASGEASDMVARELNVSRNTVTTYIKRIRDKYRQVGRPAESRVDLFRRATEDGLISRFDQ